MSERVGIRPAATSSSRLRFLQIDIPVAGARCPSSSWRWAGRPGGRQRTPGLAVLTRRQVQERLSHERSFPTLLPITGQRRRVREGDGGSFRFNVCRAYSAFPGPNQGRARAACPAGRPASVNCQRGAWRNSTLCFPKLIVRLRPDVRYTDRTGACLVGPSAFAAAAPFETITSPR